MIIDALTHATLDGRWFSTTHDASPATLLRQMDEAGVEHAVVTALAEYIPNEDVSRICRAHEDRLIPAASFNPGAWTSNADVAREARSQLRDHGYRALKLHPRLNRYDVLDPRTFALLGELAGWPAPLPVWICSFLHYPGGALRKGLVESVHELAGRFPTLKFVLAHGGGPDLLRVATAVRALPNVMLDLSYTLVQFAGSSVEADIRYLLNRFERRLVFGSDFPEISIPEALAALHRVAAPAKAGAVDRVLGENLCDFLPSLLDDMDVIPR